MSLSTFSALSALLVAVTMSPAVLNTLSFGTLVDGIPSRFLASLASSGKWDSFVFHHNRGLAFKGMEDCFLKFSSSDFTLCAIVFPGVAETIYTSPRSCSIADFLIFFAGGGHSRSHSAGASTCTIQIK